MSMYSPLMWLCCAACLVLISGIALLIGYAWKHMSAAKLWQTGLTLTIVGAIACILFGSVNWMTAGKGFGRGGSCPMMKDGTCKMMDGGMMDDGMMMDDDDMMMMMRHGDDMTMGDMVMMLEGKTGDAFDRAFIEGMIPHHAGAIEMAELALQNAGHDEIKTLAEAIKVAQQNEIDAMRSWYADWGYGELR